MIKNCSAIPTKCLKWSVVMVVIVRFLTLFAVPLLDKTEARYSEVARIMAESGEYVVPQYDYGVNFWAKPPLSTWLSSLSIELFGANELAVRLPAFLLSLLMVWVVAIFANRRGVNGWAAALVLITLPEFLIHAGVVSTDVTLSLGVMLTMLGFIDAMRIGKSEKSADSNYSKLISNVIYSNSIMPYLIFIGVGIGLIAKGPIVVLLTGGPIFLWCCLKPSRFISLFTKVPWLTGLPVMALIALPWYLLIEAKTPGFIDYFIVGEHFKRFVESGWSGDMYGFAKSQPLGIVWLFLAVSTLPWFVTLVSKIWKVRLSIFKDDYTSLLLLWILWTPLFFTTSRNLIHTYNLPVMVPIALLIAEWWSSSNRGVVRATKISLILPGVIAVALLAYPFIDSKSIMNTDKYLIEDNIDIDDLSKVKNRLVGANSEDTSKVLKVEEGSMKLYSLNSKSYSSMFYSEGKNNLVFSSEEIREEESRQQTHRREAPLLSSILELEEDFYILVHKRDLDKLKPKHRFVEIDKGMKRTLFRVEGVK